MIMGVLSFVPKLVNPNFGYFVQFWPPFGWMLKFGLAPSSFGHLSSFLWPKLTKSMATKSWLG
jgi:hypothetical protein